ncbi:hypothetical protein G3436_20030 [Pseudomonas sp. MAFF212427]|uniref:Uncharacterized protein n=1 Tax=Pseudomonas brassicae TaxID=2708063 RepID=A0A6B3P1W1_9PSED|nr:hypothetical protein [Pseudomonas brassicae]NER65734.1 hypothetical protein [Pseudomonas brassicae]
MLLKVDTLDNRAGELSSQQQVTVHGTRLDNSDGGKLLAGTRLALVLEQLINRNQGLVFGQALELRGAQLDNQRGTLGATDALRVSLANPGGRQRRPAR